MTWNEKFQKNCLSHQKSYEWCKTFPSLLAKENFDCYEDDFIKEINSIFRFLLNS